MIKNDLNKDKQQRDQEQDLIFGQIVDDVETVKRGISENKRDCEKNYESILDRMQQELGMIQNYFNNE